MSEERIHSKIDEEVRDLKVLIIEDDEFISMVYEDHLESAEQANFNIEAHTDLNSGLNALNKGKFDVLLLDLNLPDSDYEHTISIIPSIAFKVPIIIMTSTNDEKLALRTMNMGSQDYLVKDRLDRTLLIRSILYAVERHQLKSQLQEEKEKSDRLLHNILPAEVIREIQETGSAAAREFSDATILFTDFEGFTQISTTLSASELVQEIDVCFEAFDRIIRELELEKIKTIGDSYMAVGGLPKASPDSAERVVKAALRMQEFIRIRKEARATLNLPAFEMRAGIHSGSVVAGIVGTMKFQYDIWGDAVNIASRMESNGEVGEVNISKRTYEILKNSGQFLFHCQGMVKIKGKGEMEMWRVRFAHAEA